VADTLKQVAQSGKQVAQSGKQVAQSGKQVAQSGDFGPLVRRFTKNPKAMQAVNKSARKSASIGKGVATSLISAPLAKVIEELTRGGIKK